MLATPAGWLRRGRRAGASRVVRVHTGQSGKGQVTPRAHADGAVAQACGTLILGGDAVGVGAKFGYVAARCASEYGWDGLGRHEPVPAKRNWRTDGYAIAGHRERLALIYTTHDRSGVVAQLSFG